jgi:uncharacterized protein
VTYTLRKWLRPAVSGNPTVLLLLFSPRETLSVCTERGRMLRALAPAIVSQEAGPRFLGYLRSQRERLVGARGQKRVNRPELIEAHGFDTKYAMHVVRLGRQGIELLRTGRLAMPKPEPDRSRIMAIRRGEISEAEVVAEVEEVEEELMPAIEESPLPREPDREAVDAFIVATYRDAWGW